MKLLLIAILMTSATSAFAFGGDNGRYQVSIATDGAARWVIIDTQTGKTQICRHNVYVKPAVIQCSPWSNPDIFTDFSIK